MKITLSSQLTDAIKDVAANFTDGKETAKHKTLKTSSVELLKQSTAEMKDLQQSGNRIRFKKHNILINGTGAIVECFSAYMGIFIHSNPKGSVHKFHSYLSEELQ